jgi:peroxiredoxin
MALRPSLVTFLFAVGGLVVSTGLAQEKDASKAAPVKTVPSKTQAKTPDAKTPDAKKPDAKKSDAKKSDAKKSAAEPTDAEKTDAEVLAGHSNHGEAFNEGPRQKATLIGGTGAVKFPVTTSKPLAGKFVEQGVGQMFGFWYFEAERSFRQAAAIDPECAMAYWGMAMANLNNTKRAPGFIAEAVKRKAKVTSREQKYIAAAAAYIKAGSKKSKERSQALATAFEQIVLDSPNDIEAKAFLGLQLYLNRGRGIPISSYLAVDALLKQVLAKEPLHPAHHFRIHLWDHKKPQLALDSAALCGQGAPGIAHMWHMPGHIYSRLKRYNDAAWQQEASARVDHAQMIRDRLLPDQISNFAHNNEWLIRNLINVGRVEDAISLARNMSELPRHPKYNTIKNRRSSYYGRIRLFEVLSKYERWDDLIALADTPYLEPTTVETEQVRRLRYLARAHFSKSDLALGQTILADLKTRQEKATKARDEAKTKAEEKAKKEKKNDKQIAAARTAAIRPFASRVSALDRAVDEGHGWVALAEKDYENALKHFKKSRGIEPLQLARIHLLAGNATEAENVVNRDVTSHRNEVRPLAAQVEILWETKKKEEAKKAFEQLRKISSSVDLEAAPFARLNAAAQELGYPKDWRVQKLPAKDIGKRPELAKLGPFRWYPSAAPKWTLNDEKGKAHSLADYRGKPVVVIFYLGFGCLHCVEQLKAFAPMADEFEKAGLSLVAISTEDREQLTAALTAYDEDKKVEGKKKFPFPIVTDPKLDVFKSYRAHDDFENLALHGTFLIDGDGLVRWHDISYEPFMDPKFVIGEARRLLAQKITTAAK